MERRGRIPVAKFRTQEGKTRSRSRVREPDYNEQDPETDLFTLLEDNIALKEDNKTLKNEIEEYKKMQNEIQEENTKYKEELDIMRRSHIELETQIKDIVHKLNNISTEKSALEKLHKIKVEKINLLTAELQSVKENQIRDTSVPLPDSSNLRAKILKIIPSITRNEMESLLDIDEPKASALTSECLDKLIDEFVYLKNTLNNVELQLYEANEKISDLIENQNHLEEENESLRAENTNLTRVAQLLTQNMKESVETSKKMEEALIKLKQRNDDLTKQSKDLLDGQVTPVSISSETPLLTPVQDPPTPSIPTTMVDVLEEVKEGSPNRDPGERIVEMKSLMEAAIEKSTNDELKALHLKVEILEEELKKALIRAESAESALENYQQHQSSCNLQTSKSPDPAPLLPPPPPPPVPSSLLYSPVKSTMFVKVGSKSANASTASLYSCPLHSSRKDLATDKNFPDNAGGAGDSGVGDDSATICSNCRHMKQQVGAATGLDALVRELKSGKVTLRRNRRKTRTNEALQEMFQVLEISQKQNRNSQIIIDIHR